MPLGWGSFLFAGGMNGSATGLSGAGGILLEVLVELLDIDEDALVGAFAYKSTLACE